MLKEKINNNKGFTLIELVAVIAILLVIMTIAMPSITSLLGRTEDKISKEKENAFISAARDYVSDNYNTVLPSGKNKCYITLENLYNRGYLSENSYKDTNDNAYSGDSYYVIYEYVNGMNDKYDYNINKSGVSKCKPS